MGAARRKLHEQRGASMLMALLLLLVALTVSAVVIAAASSAAATLRTDKAREQSSLAVSSAAEYVRETFLNGEMDGTVKTSRRNTTYTPNSGSDGAFLGFVEYAVPVLKVNSNANDVAKWTYTLSLEGMEDVWAEFSMRYGKSKGEGASNEGDTYILTVTLRNYEDVAAPGEHPCRMTLTLYSNLKSQSGGQTVSWNGHNVIERQEAAK